MIRSSLLLALGLSPAAVMAETACHSFNVPGTFDCVYGGTSNVNVFVSAASVNDCAGTARSVEITCNLQSLFAATYAREAVCDITLPGGQMVTARLSRLADTYTTLTNSICRVALPAGTTVANMTGNWNFKFRDTFNDSGGLAESRVSNIHVNVYSRSVPSAQKTITITDGVEIARTNPQTDTGAFGQTFIKIDTPPVQYGTGQYMRVDVSASQGIPSPNRGNQPGYPGPWTVAIYNANGEVLYNGTTSMSVNFGTGGADRKDGSAGEMDGGPETTGPLYVSIMPWNVNSEMFYDNEDFPQYSQYLPRAYPSFGMRGEDQFAPYYDFNVRVQRGQEASNPDWPDLSTVYTNRPLSTVMVPTIPGEWRLVRFRLPGPIVAANGDYLDIDTSASTLQAFYDPNWRNDTEIALFDAAGNLLAADDDEGSNFASSLSFGAAAPSRPAMVTGTPGEPFNGRDGANLPAGEYYLALCMYNHTFGNGFSVTNNSPLPSDFSGQIYATITAHVTPIVACGPADIGQQGGVEGADGHLDNNDFIVFINRFFFNNPLADIGTTGGLPGSDGHLDNNDFIAFINYFFTGC
ncbi:MAG: GC-type dockerin domain-anchored protein [Phycisphaerales bacterium]